MMPPTKEQAKIEMEAALKLIDFNGPDWKSIREWLGWRRYELSLSAISEIDGAKRATLHGKSALCQELLNLKPLQNSQS